MIEEVKHEFVLPDWAKSSTIYEVNLRQYTPEGTINAFSDHIPRLKDMGVEILWLMPVFPISETKKKGELGSYYAVSDYTSVNPEFGTKKDLINLIDKIHAYKMKVILDWVPNHTGWDHHWIKSNPDFYVKNSAGEITDPLDPNTGESYGWTDVAELDYTNNSMRDSMIKDLSYWVREHDIDGFRMDIAFGVPLDFWEQARDSLFKIKSDLFMLAESEESQHLNAEVFHACYGWSLHHLMNDIANDRKSFGEFYKWKSTTDSVFKEGQLMHFITNHDENSWNGSEIERMGLSYQQFAIFTFLLDGIPLLYSGQEEPLEKRLKFFEKDNINFSKFRAAKFYKDLVHLKKNNEALWNKPYGGDLHFLAEHDHVFAIKRVKNGNTVYAIINMSNQAQKLTLKESIPAFRDYFTLTTESFDAGTEYNLKPWKTYIATFNKED